MLIILLPGGVCGLVDPAVCVAWLTRRCVAWLTRRCVAWLTGIEKLRFKPAYNPYTEPSMEIFSYHEGNTAPKPPPPVPSLG